VGPEPSPIVVLVDVTDTLSSPWVAGIQRVVRGVVGALSARPDVRCVPIVRVDGSQRFRTLTAGERERLERPPPPAPPAATAPTVARRWVDSLDERLGPGTMRAARRVVRPLRAVQYWVRDQRLRLRAERLHRDAIVRVHTPGSVLLELDAVWNQVGVDRRRWYERLHRGGVSVVPFVHDLLPLEHPEWFVDSLVEVFDHTVRLQVEVADLVLTNSEATARSVRSLAASLGRPRLDVAPVVLGADRPEEERDLVGVPVAPSGFTTLVVGTVEPRKNHRVVLDALRSIERDDPPTGVQLVVVGRAGWVADEVVEELRRRHGASLTWIEDADDLALRSWYAAADLVLVPSITEGYGLPVVEALRAGVPVLSSDGGALEELGRRCPVAVELLDPLDPAAWAAAWRRHAVDDEHHARAVRAARAAVVPNFSETAAQIVVALRGLGSSGPAPGGGAIGEGRA